MLSLLFFAAHAGEPQVLSASERIVIDHGVGDITITSSAEAQAVTIELIPIKWDEACKVEITEQGGTATVRTWSERRRGSCQADIRVVTPATADADIELGVGDLTVTRLRSLDIEIGVGDLSLLDITGSVDIELGAGNVSMDLFGRGDIEVGVGDLLLHARPGSILDASVGVGGVSILLPGGTAANTRTSIGMGEARVSVPNDPSAPTRLQIVIGVGDIEISEEPAPPVPEL